jgi:hypothetical protein
MNPILDLFDNYGRQARLFPGLLTIFPPLLAALAWFPELVTSSIGATLFTLGSSCGLLYALSSLARSRGKAIEPHLLKSWGGWPTTILLRHSSKLDPHTRSRYHQFFVKNIPGLKIPTAAEEAADPAKTDAVYDSAVKWLKEKTRGEEFALVEKENIQYGFRRNLLGMRFLGVLGCCLVLMAAGTAVAFTKPEFLTAVSSGSMSSILYQLRLMEPAVIASMAVNLIAIFGWLIIVREEWVKAAGFQYANALLACCDKLSQTR